MDFFFRPEGVAIIGASNDPFRVGYNIVKNALGGYTGRIYPVNPKYDTIQGVQCFSDIESIPNDFDLAIYFIPARFLPDTIRACARKNVKGIIIESAGFAEVGSEGRKLQEESIALAHENGIRLWGPNCMGLIDGHTRHVFSFLGEQRLWELLHPGNVSLIVQSGMLSAGFLMMILDRGGIGVAKMCSIGNKCDINEGDLLQYLIDDPLTDVIGLYIESIVDAPEFVKLCKSTRKPIVILKGGQSPAGTKAAASHTASMAGNYTITSHAFRQAGIIEVFDVNELMDFLRGFSKTRSYKNTKGTAIVSFSGAGGIITSDLLYKQDIPVAEPAPETFASLQEVFPQWMPPSHPVDIWPAIEKNGFEKVYTHIINTLMHDENVDSLIIHMLANRMSTLYLKDLARLKDLLGKPVIVWLTGTGEGLVSFRKDLEDMDIPVFEEMNRGVCFLSAARRHFNRRT
ncbi:MAG TPA: hypothetical protein ENN05_07770 [Deltaproteobacteria bacterium]|nr:hypothetical protein [Deltaproteobacteria bacterium]